MPPSLDLPICFPVLARAHRLVLSSVTATDDHQLMLAVRDGDIDQLGELFERHHRPLFGFFFNLTGQRTLSEDLVQIVFERILKYRHTYREDGSFTAWLYHMARRCASTHYRKKTPTATDPIALHDHADEGPTPDKSVAGTDDVALLRKALDELAPVDREVLVLSRLNRIPHEEIAGIMEMTVGAVKVRAHRALKELRAIYFRLEKNPLT